MKTALEAVAADGHEAMPARKSLGLVILVVAMATGLLTALLKGSALLTAVGRRPPH
jgi:hypothetical protein